jgi:hypothetical protein
MKHCDLDKVNSGSATGRAEVMAAIDGLVEEVAHLALRVKRIVSIADARRKRSESRKRAALRRRARRKTLEQAELGATSAATASDVQAVELAEASNFPLSPQQDSCTDNASRGETDLTGELTAKLEAAFPQPQDANCPEENAIAARVAELHDRLGGFIKPSLPQQPDRTT